MNSTTKLLWTIVILVFPLLGFLLYLLLGKKSKGDGESTGP